MKNIKLGTYINNTNDEAISFDFATGLTAFTKMSFVNYVTNSLVGEDRYDSIVRPLIFDFALVTFMTDIDTSFIKLRDDEGNVINPIIPIEKFLEETNVVDIIKANMEDGLIDELNKAVDKSISYSTGIHPSPLSEALASLVSTIENKVKDIDLSNLMEMTKLFTDMADDFTPENIVDAYLGSNAHKDNVIEIESAKNQKSEFAEDMDKAIKETEGSKIDAPKKTKTKSKSKKSKDESKDEFKDKE